MPPPVLSTPDTCGRETHKRVKGPPLGAGRRSWLVGRTAQSVTIGRRVWSAGSCAIEAHKKKKGRPARSIFRFSPSIIRERSKKENEHAQAVRTHVRTARTHAGCVWRKNVACVLRARDAVPKKCPARQSCSDVRFSSRVYRSAALSSAVFNPGVFSSPASIFRDCERVGRWASRRRRASCTTKCGLGDARLAHLRTRRGSTFDASHVCTCAGGAAKRRGEERWVGEWNWHDVVERSIERSLGTSANDSRDYTPIYARLNLVLCRCDAEHALSSLEYQGCRGGQEECSRRHVAPSVACARGRK
jgi:hypothetical protein